MRTKDAVIFEVRHLNDGLTRTRFRFGYTPELAFGFDVSLDLTTEATRGVFNLFTGSKDVPEYNEELAAGLFNTQSAQDIYATMDKVWPTWRADFDRMAEVGGRMRFGKRFVALTFADGETRRMEGNRRSNVEAFSDALDGLLRVFQEFRQQYMEQTQGYETSATTIIYTPSDPSEVQ